MRFICRLLLRFIIVIGGVMFLVISGFMIFLKVIQKLLQLLTGNREVIRLGRIVCTI